MPKQTWTVLIILVNLKTALLRLHPAELLQLQLAHHSLPELEIKRASPWPRAPVLQRTQGFAFEPQGTGLPLSLAPPVCPGLT